jgi:hypothetical protein
MAGTKGYCAFLDYHSHIGAYWFGNIKIEMRKMQREKKLISFIGLLKVVDR